VGVDGSPSYCNNGACGPWVVGNHSVPPAIPRLSDAPTVSTVRKMVVVTYDDDPLRSDIESYAAWLGTSAWVSVLKQYGFTSITEVDNVRLEKAPPMDDPKRPGIAWGADTMNDYAQALIDDGVLPPAAVDVIYAIFIPHHDRSAYTGFTGGLCNDDYAYHSSATLPGGSASPLHLLVVTECDHSIGIFGSSLTVMQGSFSHEFAEWASDADDHGYRFPDTTLGGVVGREDADMCSFTQFGYTDPTFGYSAVPIWSNAAIASGDSPCQPWPANVPFLNVDSDSDEYRVVRPGDTLTVELTGWSTKPYGAWPIVTIDQFGSGDFAVNPQLSAPRITNGGHVTITVTIPEDAKPGQRDAIWIESLTDDNQYVAGWPVGFQVETTP
jgi:hypothetical protein